jgi:uncharacterized Zn finger protein
MLLRAAVDDILATKMTLPKLSESIIRAGAEPQSYQRGRALWQDDAISNTAIQGAILTGECAGTSAPYYTLRVELDEGGIATAECSCPYDFGGYCKHIVALLLTYLHQPKRFVKRSDPIDLLADLDRETLQNLLVQLLADRPELADRVEALLAVPRSKSKKGKRKSIDPEIYRRQVRNIMHSLDHLRASEAYWQVGGLANELREVQTSAMKFLDAGDAETALTILLTLLEEAGDGIEYIDDSDGELGDFLNGLGLPLAEAILSLEPDVRWRSQLTQRLQKIDKHLSDYGIDGVIEIGLEALKYGWKEIPIESRAPASNENEDEEEYADDYDEDEWDDEEEYSAYSLRDGNRREDLTEAKLNVLERQGRIDEYLALCQSAKRHLHYALKLCEIDRVTDAIKFAQRQFTTTRESLQLAEKLRATKHIDKALVIGERGLKLDGPKHELGQWLGPIEEAQGREKQALAAWLAAFMEEPSSTVYQTLRRLSGTGWDRLKPQAMQALQKSWDKLPLAEVLILEEDWGEAMKLADKRDVGYQVVELVVDAVLPHQPEWAARTSVKHAERLMIEVKSKNYPIAAEWLKRAKKAYTNLGQKTAWQKYLTELKEKYKRRPALQAQLNRL